MVTAHTPSTHPVLKTPTSEFDPKLDSDAPLASLPTHPNLASKPTLTPNPTQSDAWIACRGRRTTCVPRQVPSCSRAGASDASRGRCTPVAASGGEAHSGVTYGRGPLLQARLGSTREGRPAWGAQMCAHWPPVHRRQDAVPSAHDRTQRLLLCNYRHSRSKCGGFRAFPLPQTGTSSKGLLETRPLSEFERDP